MSRSKVPSHPPSKSKTPRAPSYPVTKTPEAPQLPKSKYKPNARSRKRDVADQRRALTAHYRYQMKLSFPEIVQILREEHGIKSSLGSCHRDIEIVRENYRKLGAAAVEEHRVQCLQAYDEVEREAWGAWKRSKGPPQAQSGLQKALMEGRPQTRVGDPAFLNVIRGVQQDKREMLGIDAPKKTANANAADMDQAGWVKWLRGENEAAAREDALPPDEDPEKVVHLHAGLRELQKAGIGPEAPEEEVKP